MALDLSIISEWMVRITGFIVILVLSLVTGKVAGRLIERLLIELDVNKIVRKTGWKIELDALIGRIARFAFYLAGIAIALDYIGLYNAVFRLLAAVIIIFIIILALLYIRELVPSLIIGIFIKKKQVGSIVEFDGINGRIIDRGMTRYRIKTNDNDLIILPYSQARRLHI